jgi:hypothetical protein
MNGTLGAILLIGGVGPALAGSVMRWPDDEVPVPPLVQSFIIAECLEFAGTTEESVDACVAGERAGYRATVMMLADPATGPAAAERYRACRIGLGREGGRFHRRRAACIGGSFGFHWRLDGSRGAAATQARPAQAGPRHPAARAGMSRA